MAYCMDDIELHVVTRWQYGLMVDIDSDLTIHIPAPLVPKNL